MPNPTRAPDRPDTAIDPIARRYRGVVNIKRISSTFNDVAVTMTCGVRTIIGMAVVYGDDEDEVRVRQRGRTILFYIAVRIFPFGIVNLCGHE